MNRVFKLMLYLILFYDFAEYIMNAGLNYSLLDV